MTNRHQRILHAIGGLALASCSQGGASQEPDAGTDATSRCAESSTSEGVVINEFMAANAVSLFDRDAIAHDWVELFNTTNDDISLCGWSLTTDLRQPRLFPLLDDLVVPAGSQILVWFVGDAEAARADQVSLHLTAEGGEIGLAAPSGDFSDQVTYGRQAVDLSAARASDAGDEWLIAWHITPGQANPQEGIRDTFYSAEPGMAPTVGDLTELILGYDEIPELGIKLDPAAMDRLRDDPFSYVAGFLVYEGREYGPVGIRLKGQNSFQPIDEKPSFRINVDEYLHHANFLGLDDLTLNNMDDDLSMMHERLGYLVARQLGPASRSTHILVTVNSNFYGLYANVETVKRHMLERWFDDATGALFEGTDVDFTDDYIDAYDLESGEDERGLLEGLADALTIEDPDAAIAAASDYVEMNQFFQYWAMSIVVGQFDAFPYSDPGDDYFVYADPETNKLWFLPWGMDETFYSGSYDVRLVHSVLAKKCLASVSCYQELADHTWDALDMVDAFGLELERARIVEQIGPYITLDTRKPYEDSDVIEYQNQLHWFIVGRRANLVDLLPARSAP